MDQDSNKEQFGEEHKYTIWHNGEAQSRFLDLVGAHNFDQINVPIPPEFQDWSDDQLRRLLLSDDDLNKYVHLGYQKELDQIEGDMEKAIENQNRYLDILKERYQQELIPAANELNEKTNEYNLKVEELKHLNDTLATHKNNLSRDNVLYRLSTELNEHQQSTGQVVDQAMSQESNISDTDLKTLIDNYTDRRIEWYLIKDKLDFVERNGGISDI